MKLHPEPFEKIKSGKKTVELRLYDQKRQLLRVGDEITFSDTSDVNNTVTVRISVLYRYNSFAELYENISHIKLGYSEDEWEKADPRDMEQYYSVSEQRKYGVLGIEFERIKDEIDT